MVCHVECCEPSLDVGFHFASRCHEVELLAVTFHVGDLPEARENPGDAQVGRQFPAIGHHTTLIGGFHEPRSPRDLTGVRSLGAFTILSVTRAGGSRIVPVRRRRCVVVG